MEVLHSVWRWTRWPLVIVGLLYGAVYIYRIPAVADTTAQLFSTTITLVDSPQSSNQSAAVVLATPVLGPPPSLAIAQPAMVVAASPTVSNTAPNTFSAPRATPSGGSANTPPAAPTPPAPSPTPTPTPTSPPNIFPSSSNGPVLGGGGGGAPAPVAPVVTPPIDPTPDTTSTSTTDTSVASTTATTTPDTASSTPPTTTSIIASQEDSSATPSHYWHSDGSSGAYLALDPSSGAPGYPIGVITTTSNVLGIHIKAAFSTDGAFSNLPTFVRLFDESGNTPYACAQPSFAGYAYGNGSDAATLSNPLTQAQFEGTMVDMYFQCALGNGHDQTTAGTSYRLYIYPVSTVDITDIYVAMGASGVPFYEISSDGSF